MPTRRLIALHWAGAALVLTAGCLEWTLPEGAGEDGAPDGGASDGGASDGGVDGGRDARRDGVYPHPSGYDVAELHGADTTELGPGLCQPCHGETLEGGIGPSCEGCHPGWKTRCTFCHGGADNATGGPPEGIAGETAPTDLSVGAHTSHVEDTNVHLGRACGLCHETPTDALSAGHLDGDGRAEVRFDGLNPDGSYEASTGTCSVSYCHGNGNGGRGTILWTASDTLSCGSCHAAVGSAPAELMAMSGFHADHLEEGVSCVDCHATVVDGSDAIVDLSLHVDGAVAVAFGAGDVSWNGSTCSGTCHGASHSEVLW